MNWKMKEGVIMIDLKKTYYLVKIVDKRWADKLMDGEVFMRAIACFGDLSRRSDDSNNQFRGDSLEGFCFSFKNHHNPYEVMPNQVGLIDVLTYREKIFCLYALEYDNESGKFIKPDSRIRDFGDTAVIIYNPQEFLYRICNAMLQRFENDFWTSFKRVDYSVEFSNSQPYDEFCKSPSYSWQNEFRIVLDLAQGKFNPATINDITDFAKLTFPGKIIEDTNPDSLADSITLNIGNIRDICISLPISELFESKSFLKLIPKNSFPPKLITPLDVPRPQRPTFFKLVAKLP